MFYAGNIDEHLEYLCSKKNSEGKQPASKEVDLSAGLFGSSVWAFNHSESIPLRVLSRRELEACVSLKIGQAQSLVP